jgi:hypothetical protein
MSLGEVLVVTGPALHDLILVVFSAPCAVVAVPFLCHAE